VPTAAGDERQQRSQTEATVAALTTRTVAAASDLRASAQPDRGTCDGITVWSRTRRRRPLGMDDACQLGSAGLNGQAELSDSRENIW
jgi:hypothetical protein